MVRKVFRLLYNSIRFVGKSCYIGLLAVEVTSRIEKSRDADLRIGKRFRTRRNVEINARAGKLMIGNDVFLNSGCIVTAREELSIGDGTIFGPNVVVFDHDHKMENGQVMDDQYVCAPIRIGKNVWIGAGTIILMGSEIEDNCVVAAGSIVKGNIPAGSVFMQKREGCLRKGDRVH